MRRFLLILMAVLPVASLAACDDSTGLFGTPALAADTAIVLRAPTAAGTDGASALDGTIPVAVSPELPRFAGAWDFALRQSGTTFRLVTLDTGSPVTRPGLSRRTEAIADIEKASRRRSEYADSAVVITEGNVFTYRTRYRSGTCFSYGKLRVAKLDAAKGTATLQVVVNANCDDERLVPED